jgi:hypothetical protein
VCGDDQTVEPRLEDASDVAREVQQHGEFGAQLTDSGERCTRVVGEEDPRDDRQVAR